MNEDYSVPRAIRRSEELHARVRRFAEKSLSLKKNFLETDTYDDIALQIAKFQFDYNAGFARLLGRGSFSLQNVDEIPGLPTDAFRYARVAVHPPELDTVVYRTSGTTAVPGQHPVRDLATKETLALLQARATLFSGQTRGVVVALAEVPDEPITSSLSHMMSLFMREFDGRRLTPDPTGAAFDPRSEHRWLLGPTGVRLDELRRASKIAIVRSEPLFILSTSFALLAALEELDGGNIRTPSRTRVMITGGFKGRKTNVDESRLRQMTCRALSIEPSQIIGEYGMTELGSQLFENPETGRYVAPPWLRVRAVDPIDYKPVAPGTPGLAHFLDLCNVDSCLSVLTQDLIVVQDDEIELLGRVPRAIPRGCSLPYEGLIAGGAW